MSNNRLESNNTIENIQVILMQISIPYIIIVSLIGIAGNVITIVMLSKRSLTKNFNNCTLIALATTDLLFNLALVSRCLNDLIELDSDLFCRLLSFFSHLAELLSACFTVHFTIQRFIAVKFPLSAFIERRIQFLHYIILILFILLGISYCLMLIKNNHYENCQEELNLNWFISDALSSFVIPFTIIAVLNLLIIFHLRKTSRNNKQLSYKKRSNRNILTLNSVRKSTGSFDSISQTKLSEITTVLNTKNSKHRLSVNEEIKDHFLTVAGTPHRTASIRSTTRSQAQSHHVTRMLILVSTCFLLLNAPSHICSITLKIYTLKKSQLINNSVRNYLNQINNSNVTISTIMENPNFAYTIATISTENQSIINLNFFHIFYIIVIIAQHISYLSYSINFFLYSFCGKKFRHELLRYLLRFRKYQQ
ncbi:unnamed protein product [Rotaria sordida]|uniref:G-protein coupled receptors family 1 profile domain-containing protein n=1 Tax=Rotaria sordida TaxID=392033 RepID=A0A814NZD4_9BILA|nr:unnamed protein product [Rotaria sordida]